MPSTSREGRSRSRSRSPPPARTTRPPQPAKASTEQATLEKHLAAAIRERDFWKTAFDKLAKCAANEIFATEPPLERIINSTKWGRPGVRGTNIPTPAEATAAWALDEAIRERALELLAHREPQPPLPFGNE